MPAAAGIVNLRYKSCPEMAGQDHLGSIFSVVLYKQPDYSLTIYQAVAVGYAAVIMPTVLVLSVVNIFMGKAERTCK
ncbi:hypothetical protein [Enterobacter kobei]|uniref:hypothetical protein n=1 Tax=Enterobacter kobei TaxID=208224 RepID=UPI0039C8E9FD